MQNNNAQNANSDSSQPQSANDTTSTNSNMKQSTSKMTKTTQILLKTQLTHQLNKHHNLLKNNHLNIIKKLKIHLLHHLKTQLNQHKTQTHNNLPMMMATTIKHPTTIKTRFSLCHKQMTIQILNKMLQISTINLI